MLAEMNFDYKPFIKEAYIDPIRTVTVIDDEYPTLEALIGKGKEEFQQEDIDRLSEIIAVSRDSKYNWLLDVYDGEEDSFSDDKVASRLHHSDLLILDYHLDGEDDGLCEKSINIIRNLSNNRHFNIVAVHTKGYTNEKGGVNDVFVDIVLSLQSKPKLATIHPKPKQIVDDALDEWELENADIRSSLLNSISQLELLFLLKNHEKSLSKCEITHEYLEEFFSIYEEKPEEITLCKKILMRWLCTEKFKEYTAQFNEKTASHFDWAIDENINWIKTEDLFLTVIGKKQTSVSEIPNKLVEAIEGWRPHPHKLILSKLKNEIESKGMSAASNILNKKHLQAAWLKDLLKANNNYEVQTAAWDTVSKLWEELASEIKSDLGKFTIALVNSIKGSEQNENVLSCFIDASIIDDQTEQILQANCFICSRSITTHHVITGHILEINNNYWLCLTPICDLVPGQKIKQKTSETYGDDESEMSSLMPVTLVQLFDAKEALKNTRKNMVESLKISSEQVPDFTDADFMEQVIEYSTANNIIFIKPNNKSEEIKALSFTVGIDGKANPKAKDFYIENQGIFDNEDYEVKMHSAEPCESGQELQINSSTGIVVAELRYEYALNLLGKLGVAKSRVGLDFIK